MQTITFGNYKQALINEAFELDVLLKKYIAIHNNRLNNAGTFASLFRKVDFKSIFEEVSSIHWEFDQQRTQLLALQGDYSEYSKIQQQFYDTLNNYFDALFEAVETLQLLSEKQYQLSQGSGAGKLTLNENLAYEKRYKEQIQKYTELGNNLNQAFKQLTSEVVKEQ